VSMDPTGSGLGVMPLAMFGLGPMELLIVAGIVLLLFGSRLPKVMRSLGEGIVEFKRGVQGIEEDPAARHGDANRAEGR
jgi:sec-independent protein translocase protein TatA